MAGSLVNDAPMSITYVCAVSMEMVCISFTTDILNVNVQASVMEKV